MAAGSTPVLSTPNPRGHPCAACNHPSTCACHPANLSFANQFKTAFSPHKRSSHFLSSPCSWIPDSMSSFCFSSLTGGLQRREPVAVLAAKTCPRVHLLLEEVPGVSPQRPAAHRVSSSGQAVPPKPCSTPLPNATGCSLPGAQAQGEMCAAPFSPAGGPGFGNGSAGSEGASPHSAQQAVSQGISLCLGKGCL